MEVVLFKLVSDLAMPRGHHVMPYVAGMCWGMYIQIGTLGLGTFGYWVLA